MSRRGEERLSEGTHRREPLDRRPGDLVCTRRRLVGAASGGRGHPRYAVLGPREFPLIFPGARLHVSNDSGVTVLARSIDGLSPLEARFA